MSILDVRPTREYWEMKKRIAKIKAEKKLKRKLSTQSNRGLLRVIKKV